MSGSQRLLDELLDRAAEAGDALSAEGVRLEYGKTDKKPKRGAWINGDADQRVGQLLLWETGELDVQVLRRSDAMPVVNEHRVISDTGDVASALATFLWALAYIDRRDAA